MMLNLLKQTSPQPVTLAGTRRWFKSAALVASIMLIAACGGGAGGSAGAGGVLGAGTTNAAVTQLELSSSATQLGSGGASSATLTVSAKNANNLVVPDVDVSYAATSGDLYISNSKTDSTGKSKAILSVGANKANRVISITATAGSITSTISVDVKGTILTVSAPSAVGLSSPITLLATLKDSSATAISSTPISITSSLGNVSNKTCVPANCATDSSGSLSFTYTPTIGGADTITLAALGANSTQTITAATSLITVTVAPDSGTTAANEFSVNQNNKVVRVSMNAPISNFPATINLSSTAGTISPSTITLTSPNSINSSAVLATNTSVGSGVILATHAVSGGVSNSFAFEIVSRIPASITLQATPNVIAANPVGSTLNKAAITATVRDIVGNPVKGATVSFAKPIDTSSGSLQSATALTDIAGTATTNYIAGPNAAAASTGVKIDATVAGLTGAPASTSVTVAQQALYVNLGFANSLVVVSPTQYSKEFSVSVSDAAGQPVAGANVSVALLPKSFYKGEMVKSANGWFAARLFSLGNPLATPPIANVYVAPHKCANEDLNYNGTIESVGGTSEDVNGNGVLDPGIRPIVTQLSGGAQAGTTGASGFATYKITYLKQDALWSEYTVTASSSTVGGGAQGNASQAFLLPVVAGDVQDTNVSPPNPVSPFGLGQLADNTCTNTN